MYKEKKDERKEHGRFEKMADKIYGDTPQKVHYNLSKNKNRKLI